MDNISCVFGGEDEQMDLPAGFRFHPTDEELITYYLSPKVLNSNFSARAIGEVDLNKCEPWDLPKRAKMGEKEWYFYCVRDRKYPTGLRTNRATEAGYWKATGKDKEIYREKSLVGMKKTLVFYKGRAPKGEKSNWVMHEYRLEGKNHPTSAKNEWVICRVFEKNSSGKKIPFPGLMRSEAAELPPLMDSSPSLSHVPCFSNTMIAQENLGGFGATNANQYPQPQGYYPEAAHHINQFRSNQLQQYPIPFPIPYGRYGAYNENEVLRSILWNGSNGGTEDKQGMMKTEGVTFSVSQDASLSTTEMNAEISSVVSNYGLGRAPFDDFHEAPSASGGPIDIDALLDYRSSGNWS